MASAPDLQAAFWILVHDTERRFDAADARLTKLDRSLSGRLEERSYRTFADVLSLLTANARSFVTGRAEVFRRSEDARVRNSMYKNVRNVAEQFALTVESPLRLLEVDRSERIELFAGPMSRLAKQTVRHAEVVFLPSARSIYEIEPFTADAADLLLLGGGATMRREFGPAQILQLRYPAARGDELFQHAVFAHELAHAAIAQPKSETDDARTWETAAAGQLPAGAPELGEAAAGLRNWFTELACDVLAMRLIGPVFAVAYAEVTAVHRKREQDGGVRTHPAPELRFAVLREELERFCALLPDDVAGPLRAYGHVHEGTHGGRPPSPQAKRWLTDALTRFRDSLPAMLRPTGAEYEPRALADDLPVVRSAIDRAAYPAERIVAFTKDADAADWSVPLDWRSVLNGTLLDHLARTGPPGADAQSGDRTARERATALAAGGIELSELHRRSAGLIAQAAPFSLTT